MFVQYKADQTEYFYKRPFLRFCGMASRAYFMIKTSKQIDYKNGVRDKKNLSFWLLDQSKEKNHNLWDKMIWNKYK